MWFLNTRCRCTDSCWLRHGCHDFGPAEPAAGAGWLRDDGVRTDCANFAFDRLAEMPSAGHAAVYALLGAPIRHLCEDGPGRLSLSTIIPIITIR